MRGTEETIISHVETATRLVYAEALVDPVHVIAHTERVVANIIRICKGDNVPLLKPVVAAWLHDYGRPAEFLARKNRLEFHHAVESARQVPIILRPFREALGKAAISEIQNAVFVHSKLNSSDDDLTTKTLKDANMLDGLGSAGLTRTITATHTNPLCNLSNPFPSRRIERGNEMKQEITIAETILYTIEWVSMLRMPTAIRLGSLRVQKQIGFLEGLVEELGLSRDLLEVNTIIQEAKRLMQQVPISL